MSRPQASASKVLQWSKDCYTMDQLFELVHRHGPNVMVADEGYHGSYTETISSDDIIYAYRALRQCRVVIQTGHGARYSFPSSFAPLFVVESDRQQRQLSLEKILRKNLSATSPCNLPIRIYLSQIRENVRLYNSLTRLEAPLPGERLSIVKVYDAKFLVYLNIFNDQLHLVDSILPLHIDVSMRRAVGARNGRAQWQCFNKFLMHQLTVRNQKLGSRPLNEYLDGIIEVTYDGKFCEIANRHTFNASLENSKHFVAEARLLAAPNSQRPNRNVNKHSIHERKSPIPDSVEIDFGILSNAEYEKNIFSKYRESTTHLYSSITSIKDLYNSSNQKSFRERPALADKNSEGNKRFSDINPERNFHPSLTRSQEQTPSDQIRRHISLHAGKRNLPNLTAITELQAIGMNDMQLELQAKFKEINLLHEDTNKTQLIAPPSNPSSNQPSIPPRDPARNLPSNPKEIDVGLHKSNKFNLPPANRLAKQQSSSTVSAADGGRCLPPNIQSFNLDEVRDFLDMLNLKKYAEKFALNLIDGKMLMQLTREDMVADLGMSQIESKRLFMAVNKGWRPLRD